MRRWDGELVELSVERVGAVGDGIARWRGEPVFLPFTVPGDHVRARLGARRGGGLEAHTIEFLGAGPGRSPAPCRHFGACGGCALQHLNPDLYRSVKLGRLLNALERAGIDSGVVEPLQMVPPVRRRTRLGLARHRDPRQPVRAGFRKRFSHELVDLHECLVLEPALFALVGELRRVVPDLLPPGGMAEATLSRTDSGIDLLLEVAQPPGLGALEALARLGDDCDLARIVWRSPEGEIPVVEHRPVRVLLSGSPFHSRLALFCRRAKRPRASSSKRFSPGSVRIAQCSIFSPGSAPLPLRWPAADQCMPSRAISAVPPRLPAPLPMHPVSLSSAAISRAIRCRPKPWPRTPPRCSTRRALAPPARPRCWPPLHSTQWSPFPATPRPSPATPPG